MCPFFAKNDVGMGHFRVTLPENPAGELLFFFFGAKNDPGMGLLSVQGSFWVGGLGPFGACGVGDSDFLTSRIFCRAKKSWHGERNCRLWRASPHIYRRHQRCPLSVGYELPNSIYLYLNGLLWGSLQLKFQGGYSNY